MKDFFLEEIRKRGGYSCYHAHFDKAYLMTPDIFSKCQVGISWKDML